ncbi:hypothetical protein MMC07_004880 [Pseudocyphellaria aurata]|nr:hypothetical protein [Pseudocyphellaria aurata]
MAPECEPTSRGSTCSNSTRSQTSSANGQTGRSFGDALISRDLKYFCDVVRDENISPPTQKGQDKPSDGFYASPDAMIDITGPFTLRSSILDRADCQSPSLPPRRTLSSVVTALQVWCSSRQVSIQSQRLVDRQLAFMKRGQDKGSGGGDGAPAELAGASGPGADTGASATARTAPGRAQQVP